jgi:hypothetical protein
LRVDAFIEFSSGGKVSAMSGCHHAAETIDHVEEESE